MAILLLREGKAELFHNQDHQRIVHRDFTAGPVVVVLIELILEVSTDGKDVWTRFLEDVRIYFLVIVKANVI